MATFSVLLHFLSHPQSTNATLLSSPLRQLLRSRAYFVTVSPSGTHQSEVSATQKQDKEPVSATYYRHAVILQSAAFLGDGQRTFNQLAAKRGEMISGRFSVFAATEGSANSSKSEETIPTTARPIQMGPLPPWARDEGKGYTAQQSFEAFLWFKYVEAAIKEAEEQDRRDGYK